MALQAQEYGATACAIDLGAVDSLNAASTRKWLLGISATATLACVGLIAYSAGFHVKSELFAQPQPAIHARASMRSGMDVRTLTNQQGFVGTSNVGNANGLHGAQQPSATRLDSVNAAAYLSMLVPAAGSGLAGWGPLAGLITVFTAIAWGIKKVLDTPSRTYNPADVNVGKEYDAWTQEGVLEYYWGEHIHLGYYSPELRKRGNYTNWEFIQAKIDFINKMFEWSESSTPSSILDVGCGIGGTSRQLAERFTNAQVTGITLSPKQVERGMELVKERKIDNCQLKVMDALKMDFPDNSFDLVWGCESGEHMPDKKKYVEEMVRVLKPGGTLVIATWCQREETPATPFTQSEKDKLQFLYDEWAHPYFISKEEYARLLEGTGECKQVKAADWNTETIDSWRHSIWVGIRDPMGLLCKGPKVLYRCLRDAITLERMHRAFACGLMEYGMLRATKKIPLQEGGTRVGFQSDNH
jgi:MPBQ/MSBQ methyltransferase